MSDKILAFYKRFISPLFAPCCRFYPSCSEYSALCFKFHNPAIALLKTLTRLLRCNQLFKGGIDYPKIKHIKSHKILQNRAQKVQIAFYFVPCANKNFYIIKSLKG